MQQISFFPVFFYDFRLQLRCSSFVSTLKHAFEILLQQFCCSSFVPAFTVSFRHAAALPLSCLYYFRLQLRCSSFVSALKHVFEPLLQ
jgi:hypothetical protein